MSGESFGQAPVLCDPETEAEMRGYEVAKLQGEQWVQVAQYAPSQVGWDKAWMEALWLQERNPKVRYDVRAVISLKPGQTEEVDG